MKKALLVAVSILGINQVASAENAEVLKCIDKKSMTFESSCVAKTFDKHIKQDQFFAHLAKKKIESTQHAFATVTLYPKDNLIAVRSLEASEKPILLANR